MSKTSTREQVATDTSKEYNNSILFLGHTLLRASEDMIETLEENQVNIQNMMTSKFIGHFLDDISSWQKTLSIVDQVISLWFDVQRTWSHLESIFVGSEDIRLQLPNDSQRFDETNQKFQKKIKLMSKIPNVIKATAIPGLAEELEVILVDNFTLFLFKR